MKYIPADKVIADIEQKIKNFSIMHNTAASKKDYESMSRVDPVIAQLRNVLEVVKSLQQEQPEMDLEKELDQWRHKHFKGKRDGDYSGEYLERESQLDLARHFCKVGKEIMKEKAIEWFDKNWRKYIIGPDSDGCIGFNFWKDSFRKDTEK